LLDYGSRDEEIVENCSEIFKDSQFHILEPVVRWIVHSRSRDSISHHLSADRKDQYSLFKCGMMSKSSRRLLIASSSENHGSVWNNPLFRMGGNNNDSSPRIESSFPKFAVFLTEDVEFILRVLSEVLDDSEEDHFPADDIPCELSVDEVMDTLVSEFASLPAFLATILLCEEFAVEKLVNLSFVKYIMLEKASIGN